MICHLKNDEQHKHKNGGGWVANTAHVEDSVYVGEYALVYGNVVATGNVHIEDTSRVSGSAKLSGSVRIYGNAWIDKGTYTGNIQIHLNERPVNKQERLRPSED